MAEAVVVIFRVADALFSPGVAHDTDRVAFWRHARERRHVVRVDSGQALFSRWLESLGTRLAAEISLLQSHLRRIPAAALAYGQATVEVAPEPESLDQAIRIARTPLHVLVEDGINDRAFLLRVMPPHWRRRLLDAEAQGRLVFEHGGGISSQARQVERHGVDRVWRDTRFVVFDHDGDTRGAPSPESRKLAKACQSVGMQGRFHRLQRRDLEAYIPRDLMVHANGRDTTKDVREVRSAWIQDHFARPEAERWFMKLNDSRHRQPSYFKNAFVDFDDDEDLWQPEWFVDCAVEMTLLAERLMALV